MDNKPDTSVLGINIDGLSKEFKEILIDQFKPEFLIYYRKLLIKYQNNQL